jgi:F-type H+-transporting ATPase subunit delta
MRNEALVKRYAEALTAALKTDDEYRAVSLDLAGFTDLIEKNHQLREILLRSFLTTSKKAQIVEDIMNRQSYEAKTCRLILLLLEHKRLDILPGIVAIFPELWEQKKGIVTLEVSSVVPLKAGQKQKLESKLRRLEKRAIHCTYAIDPGIVAGLYIKKGNLVYDASLKGQLEKLKDIIREG